MDMESIIKSENQTLVELSNIELDENYANEWNERSTDFIMISVNGQPIRNTLYRKGGVFNRLKNNKGYFMLIKYTEDMHPIRKEFGIKTQADRKYLKGTWVIISETGEEMVEFDDNLHYAYIINNSRFYMYKDMVYDCVTGFCYGFSKKMMENETSLFVYPKTEKSFYVPKEGETILQINKIDGTFKTLR